MYVKCELNPRGAKPLHVFILGRTLPGPISVDINSSLSLALYSLLVLVSVGQFVLSVSVGNLFAKLPRRDCLKSFTVPARDISGLLRFGVIPIS